MFVGVHTDPQTDEKFVGSPLQHVQDTVPRDHDAFGFFPNSGFVRFVSAILTSPRRGASPAVEVDLDAEAPGRQVHQEVIAHLRRGGEVLLGLAVKLRSHGGRPGQQGAIWARFLWASSH